MLSNVAVDSFWVIAAHVAMPVLICVSIFPARMIESSEELRFAFMGAKMVLCSWASGAAGKGRLSTFGALDLKEVLSNESAAPNLSIPEPLSGGKFGERDSSVFMCLQWL